MHVLTAHLCLSKVSSARRLNASAATVLSRRGAVMPHGQSGQHQPVKSSPSTQINRLFIHLPRLWLRWDLSSAARGGTHQCASAEGLLPIATGNFPRNFSEAK